MWLQTNSKQLLEVCFGTKTNCIRKRLLSSSSYNHNTLATHRKPSEPEGITCLHEASYCSLKCICNGSFHRCSEGYQCIVVVRGTGQKPLTLPYASSLQYQNNLSQLLLLQFVCNQGNHFKTTNLFLKCIYSASKLHGCRRDQSYLLT